MISHLNAKNFQINSLIDEVGGLKAENLTITETMDQKSKEFDFLLHRFDRYRDQFGDLDGARFDEVTRSLSEALTQQTDKIETLSSLNYKLQKKMGIPEYPESFLDILIVGTHSKLTDTIMLATLNPIQKTITFLSVPRDFYINGRKINEVYSRYGIEKLKEHIYDITGVKIDKYVVVDLEAFSQAVDLLGGITVNVEKDLYDLQYPGTNNSYITFSISKGEHELDGDTALKYARSRHSTSDFDRAKRQQQILQAMLNAFQNFRPLENIQKSIEMVSSLSEKVNTDIDPLSALAYFRLYQNFTLETGNVLSTSNYLYSTLSQTGQYILLPSHGNFSAIRSYIETLIKN